MIDCPLNKLSVSRGSSRYNAKLSECDVKQIRDLISYRDDLLNRARQVTFKKLSEKFGVSSNVIQRIAYGEAWTHVE